METRGTCALIKLGYGMKFLLKSFDALHCFFTIQKVTFYLVKMNFCNSIELLKEETKKQNIL